MKRIISTIIILVLTMTICSCGKGKYSKTTTHYKDNILWGMTVDEVADELGDLVKSKDEKTIIAYNDVRGGIDIFAGSFSGGEANYIFSDNGNLREITMKVEDSSIDYDDFDELVDLYGLKYDDIEVRELKRDEHQDGIIIETCSAGCEIDERTEFTITYIKYRGIMDEKGCLTASFRNIN